MLTRTIRLAGHATVVALSLAALAAPATAASWPSGKIEMIIPSSPGGGFDTYARVLGKAMGDELHINVVPKNISGGAGMRGARAAFNARPDGQTFAIFNVPGIIQPIIAGKNPGYDMDKIDWLGAMAFNQYIIVVKKDSPYKTLADLKKSGKTVTFTGYGSSGLAANRVFCSVVGLKCQIITGYPGNNDALLAVVRGDAIASVTPITTATSFNAGGDLKGLLLMTDRDVAAFPHTQKATDAGYPSLASLGLIRAFGLPAGVKPDVRKAFAEAFKKAMNSEQVKAWAKKSRSPLDPMNGQELAKLIKSQTQLLMKYKDVITKQK